MRTLTKLIALALACGGPSVAAKQPCAPRPADSTSYPWKVPGVMPGDEYGDVYVDIDGEGVPTGCRFGETNIHDASRKFNICIAFMQHWHKSQANGSAQTLKEKFITYGGKHEKAEREARKLYFQQHPEDRQSCYPNTI